MAISSPEDLDEARQVLYSTREEHDPPSVEEVTSKTSELLDEFLKLARECGFETRSAGPYSHDVWLSAQARVIEVSLDREGRIGFRLKGSKESPALHAFELDRYSGALSTSTMPGTAPIVSLAETLQAYL